MSLHRPTQHGSGELPATCACGWQADDARVFMDERDEDYRQHVEAMLGPDAYYSAGAACTNCGHHQTACVLVGRPVRGGHCERCGTSSLVPRNDVADDHERSKGWG